MKKSFGLLAVLVFLTTLFAGCEALYNGDLRDSLDKDLHTNYTFYYDNPDTNESAENSVQSYKIGSTRSAKDFPSLTRKGYHIVGWNYLRNPLTKSADCPKTIFLDTDGYVRSFTVTPQPAFLLAVWQAGDPEPEVDPEKTYFTVTYIARDGTTELGKRTVEKGTAPGQPAFEDTDGDYTFVGWYLDSECTKAFDVYKDTVSGDTSLYSKWAVMRTLTFHKNDGTDAVAEQKAAEGETYILPAYTTLFADSPEGYYFQGWALSSGSKTADYHEGAPYSPVTGDLHFYAVWTSQYYTVHFVNTNPDISEVAEVRVAADSFGNLKSLYEMNVAFTVPVNHEFYGFTIDPAATEPDESLLSDRLFTDDLTVYVLWKAYNPDAPVYTITFIGRDGTTVVNTQKVRQGEYAQWFDYNYTDGEYEHRGWYKDYGTWNEWFDMGGTPITEDLTVYGYWPRVRYITYHRNDGTAETDENYWQTRNRYSYIYNDSAWIYDGSTMFSDLPESQYFLKWNTRADGSGTDYFMGDTIENFTEDLDLYAVWTSDYCTVTLINSANLSEKLEKKVGRGSKQRLDDIYWQATEYGSKEIFTTPAYYYHKEGFATTADATENDPASWNYITFTEDQTWYMLWGITLIGHHGWYWDDAKTNESQYSCTYFYGQAITDPSEKYGTPWREHYTFTRWYKDEACTAPATFPLSPSDAVKDDGDYYRLHLYAGWEIEKYTVRFIYNVSGTEVTYQTQEVAYGEKVTKPADPEIEGYVFGGWYNDWAYTDSFDFENDSVEGEMQIIGKLTLEPHIYVAETGDDRTSESIGDIVGTQSQPFASLSRALEKISFHYYSDYNWTIHVDGTLRGIYDINLSDTAAASVTIVGEGGAVLSGDADNDGTGDDTVLSVTSNVPLTLKHITLTKGNGIGAGALYVGSSANVTLGEGVVITANSTRDAAYNGGGVYNDGTLTLAGAVISNNTAKNGGGIYIHSGSVTLTNNAIIQKNVSVNGGSGIYVNGATLALEDGSITENETSGLGDGHGVYLASGSTFTMTGGTISKNNYTANITPSQGTALGGGVFVENGAAFTMQDGSIEQNNGFSGGAVYTFGSFTMSGGTLDSNVLKRESSITGTNAVEVGAGGLFTMTGGSIVSSFTSPSSTSAGAVNIYTPQGAYRPGTGEGRFVMTGGSISGITAQHVIQLHGDGPSSTNNAVFEMSGGTISGCTSTRTGSVYVNRGTFTMTGGTISGCTASRGGAVYLESGDFSMGGSASIPCSGTENNNDVYLTSGCYITVDDTLSAEAPVATITPSGYSTSTKVLSGSAIGSEYSKFAVTPNGSDSYIINNTGYLALPQAPLDVSVTLPEYSQIPVTMTKSDQTVNFTIDAADGSWFDFAWVFDGEAVSNCTENSGAKLGSSAASLTVYANTLVKGLYDVELTAKHTVNGVEESVSYFAQVRVE
ncbi:MAG: InlB B-repeat-containing protein [Treponema sp.]|nr:InlB B-repeat-containing protein [Treponema sp.]